VSRIPTHAEIWNATPLRAAARPADPALLEAALAETPERALRHEVARGLYPVHRGMLWELAAEAAVRRRVREK
jgi:hypothetical protein